MNGFYNSVQEWLDAGMPVNSFICGDCMQGMVAINDKHFGLALVDPPYGKNSDYEVGRHSFNKRGNAWAKPKYYENKGWDKKPPTKIYWRELFRVSKNQIAWGGNHFKLPLKNEWIVWNKKTGNSTYGDCELAWTSFNGAVRLFEYRWHGMLQENMRCKEERIHPTQKPVALYRWLLQNYATPGQIVVDTHVGSASSLIACEQMNFPYVGFEIDHDYFDAACKRILQARELLKQKDMFQPEKSNGKNTGEIIELAF